MDSELKKGAILSYANIFIVNLIGVFITPFIVKSLGNSEYGVYTLVGSLIAYISLMDFGLSNTVIRFISFYRSKECESDVSPCVSLIFFLYILIAIVALSIGILIYFFLPNIFSKNFSSTEIELIKVLYMILLVNVVVSFPLNVFNGVCMAYEKFTYVKSSQLCKYLLRTLCVLLFLSFGYKALSIVLIDTLLNVIFGLSFFVYCLKKIKIKISIPSFSLQEIKSIFNYSFWVFLLAITQIIQWNSCQLIAGFNFGALDVAICSVGIMLGTYFGSFGSAINGMLLPRASRLIALNHTGDHITREITKFAIVINTFSFCILGGFIVVGRDFILLWLGTDYELSWWIALFIMLATVVPLSQSLGCSILEAKKNIKERSLFYCITIILGSISGYCLSLVWGLTLIPLSISLAILLNVCFVNLLFKKTFNFKIKVFVNKAVIPFFIILFLSIAVYMVLAKTCFVAFNSWLELFIGICLYIAIYCSFVFVLFHKKIMSYFHEKSSIKD